MEVTGCEECDDVFTLEQTLDCKYTLSSDQNQLLIGDRLFQNSWRSVLPPEALGRSLIEGREGFRAHTQHFSSVSLEPKLGTLLTTETHREVHEDS